MPEELSAKAKTALLELNERAAGDQPLMVEWDIQTELKKVSWFQRLRAADV
ncbi:hypothetical protein [Caballeronia sp. 15715]|uniref:hypothetical protein n=1 Tax=unclassified Caballeronia TaxID=2646786 RepID=UPI0039E657DD